MLNLAVMSGNVAGRSKQVVSNTLVFVAWAAGNAIGPQVFRENDGPRYIKAWTAHVIMYAIQCGTLVFLRLYLIRRNVLKRRAQGKEVTKEGGEAAGENIGHSNAFADLTDRENPDCEFIISIKCCYDMLTMCLFFSPLRLLMLICTLSLYLYDLQNL